MRGDSFEGTFEGTKVPSKVPSKVRKYLYESTSGSRPYFRKYESTFVLPYLRTFEVTVDGYSRPTRVPSYSVRVLQLYFRMYFHTVRVQYSTAPWEGEGVKSSSLDGWRDSLLETTARPAKSLMSALP